MVELSKANDIELVLVKAPALYPHWHDEWDAQMILFAEEHDLLYINLLEYIDDIGLDFDTDTFNAGLHLNVFGAEKVAAFFGNILKEEFDLPDHRGDSAVASIWNELSELYHDTVGKQLMEINETGKIQSILAVRN
jgi:hypothetical protein